MGGGTERVCESVGLNPGLSPRGRRHHDPEGARPLRRGSISAWAEAPFTDKDWTARRRVYLRVGGGTRPGRAPRRPPSGLSPRGRRHPRQRHLFPTCQRSISAWAEAPLPIRGPIIVATVYLRVGGGTQAQRRVGHRVQGLSPRGRRHRNCGAFRGHLARSISAWAEAPRSSPASPRCRGVYLRVGGGTSRDPSECDPSEGLSPRGRRHPSFILSRPPGKPGDPP